MLHKQYILNYILYIILYKYAMLYYFILLYMLYIIYNVIKQESLGIV